jgi:hypothetical protein
MEYRNLSFKVFNSLEEEAESEYQRRSEQSHQDRIHEFSLLQERCWGEKWTQSKLDPIITFEKVTW